MNRNKLNIWLCFGGLILFFVLLSPLASSSPDGLEWVAEKLHFIDKAESKEFYTISPLFNYSIISGVVGVLLSFSFLYMFFLCSIKKKRQCK